jgi:choloylglycine hydrolase
MLYTSEDGLVITGRSMDWAEDMYSNLWVFPRGMKHDGASGSDTVRWTSKYGSLAISSYEAGVADGMNEKGLVMNGLYLAESDYGKPDGRPTMSIMTAGMYVLDNFASVEEVVRGLGGDTFRIIAPLLPNGRGATCHLSVSDSDGDSAIFEWINGKVVVHHSREYKIMTNSPTFDEQLAIEKYWQGVDPLTFLPGSINAADRFARLSFYVNAIPTKLDPNTINAVPGGSWENQAVAAVLSAMRSIGVPLGISHPTKPNISSTLWRTVHDQKNKVVFFDSATSPNTFWVPLADLDFAESAPIRKLTVAGGKIYAGNTAAQFEPSPPLQFTPAPALTH